MSRKSNYSISELAREFQVTTRAIRFYEEKGLLEPSRDGQARIFSAADRVKLKLILRGKRLGFSLEESRAIIEMYNPEHSNDAQLLRVIEGIQRQRQQLQQQLKDIEAMMQELDQAEQTCREALDTNT